MAGEKRGQLWGHGDSSQDVVREDVGGGAGNKPSGCLGVGEVAHGGLEVERGPGECAAEWIGPRDRVWVVWGGGVPALEQNQERPVAGRCDWWEHGGIFGERHSGICSGRECWVEGQEGVGRAGCKSCGREEGTRLYPGQGRGFISVFGFKAQELF